MKRIIAFLLIAALAISFAACGSKTMPETETTSETQIESTTDPAVTEPEIGRIGEKGAFYVYIPEKWCKMEYTGDSTRIRLFDIPSAPKIEEGKTAEVEIKVSAEAGKQADVDAAAAELLKIKGAEKGKDVKIDGSNFTVVTYTDASEERVYTTYVGLGGGSLATVALKGIEPTDEDAAAILRSISFKPLGKRVEPTKPATTKKAASTTKAAASTTKAAASTTKAAASTTKAAASATKAAASTTKAAASTTKAAASTTKAAASTTKAAASTTKAAASTTKAAASTTKAAASATKAAATTAKPAAKTTKAAS